MRLAFRSSCRLYPRIATEFLRNRRMVGALRLGRRFYSDKGVNSFDLSGFLGRIEALQNNQKVGRPHKPRRRVSAAKPKTDTPKTSASRPQRPPRAPRNTESGNAVQNSSRPQQQRSRPRTEHKKQPNAVTVNAAKESESTFNPKFSSLSTSPLPKAGARRPGGTASRKSRRAPNRVRVARSSDNSDGGRFSGLGASVGDPGFMYSHDALSLVENNEKKGGGFISLEDMSPGALVKYMPPSAVTYNVRVLSALHSSKIDTAKTRLTGAYPAPVEDSLVGHQLARNPTLAVPQQQFLARVAAGQVKPAQVR